MSIFKRLPAESRGIFRNLFPVPLVFALAAGGVSASELAAGPHAASWTLGTPSVVSSGTEQQMPEGRFIQDYVLETSASSDDVALIPQATLRLELSLFSPNANRGVQKKGHWYVTGKWVLKDANNADGSVKPSTLGGLINTDLSFNPAVDATQPWAAATQVPFATFVGAEDSGTGQKIRGDGKISLGASPASTLSLQLKVFPKVN